jgi:hypothetical protein
MTTIDERLSNLFKEHIDIVSDGWWHPNYGSNEMKADIKKLFLDLIAEAKPDYDSKTSRKYNAVNSDAARAHRSGYKLGVREYENNLIQAINGGKK